MSLKNHFKRIPVSFKFYADFECKLKSVESCEGSCTKKYQDHVPCSFAYKLVCDTDKFDKPIVVYRGKNAAYKFIEVFLRVYEYCKKVMKKQFNKNLIITGEKKKTQSSNMCWICAKLIGNEKLEIIVT